MSTFKARGIVLKEVLVGESDKILTLLLKGTGKLTVSAKGSRRPTSKFLAGTQLFTYADFVIYDGGRFNTMAQIDVIEGFYDIRNDFERLCYGTYFLELTDKVLMSGENCDDFLLLLITALSSIAKSRVVPGLAARAFEFKFLQLNGYGPEICACSHCGGELGDTIYFSGNGCICGQCKISAPSAFEISGAALCAIRYVMDSEMRTAFSFTVSMKVYSELKRSSSAVMAQNLEVSAKSLELLGE